MDRKGIGESMKIQLHLACNNDNGNHTGLISAVEVLDTIYLEGEPVSLTIGHGAMSITGMRFDLNGYGRWVGNICWDCATLESADVATIINYLRTLGWSCTEAESGLFDKFHAGQEITAKELEELQR